MDAGRHDQAAIGGLRHAVAENRRAQITGAGTAATQLKRVAGAGAGGRAQRYRVDQRRTFGRAVVAQARCARLHH